MRGPYSGSPAELKLPVLDFLIGGCVDMGPLQGLRVLEIASLAPGPFGCMMLADLGADVVTIMRPSKAAGDENLQPPRDPLTRGRSSVTLDLKSEDGRQETLSLVEHADVLVEGSRPGVAERLAIGPDVCLDRNARLVYARMTGWGQAGPMAGLAGHDINYIGLSGALDLIGRAGDPPTVPANLVGDFGGGGMLLAFGVLAALYERNTSGLGQVIDVAMVDGSALLTASLHGLIAAGLWKERGTNVLDGGAPFYDTYETADGRYMSVGAIEREFYENLIEGLGLSSASLPARSDRASWPLLREQFARAFKTRSRDEWAAHFHDIDACVSPVLSPVEASSHEHATTREAFVRVGDLSQPAPAPRFSRTPATAPKPATVARGGPSEVLTRWNVKDRPHPNRE